MKSHQRCSSSIESVFAFEFTSIILDGELKDVHSLYSEWKEKNPEAPLPDEKCSNCGWNKCG